MSEKIFEELAEAVLSFDVDRAVEASKRALSSGVDPIDVIDKGLGRGLRIVGKKFEDGELFLMHIAVAADIAKRAMDEVIGPELSKRGRERKGIGRVVIGTVEGDIHDIGKNLVAAMLSVAGFEVYDLGRDVPASRFIEKAREVNADIIAASALLSTTMPVQRRIAEVLEKEGLKEKVKIMVGGAPVTREWAEIIGADGYGGDAVMAVKVAKRLLGVKE